MVADVRGYEMEMKTMELPTRMIHQSFRYVLGRQSYAVSDWCDWFRANYKEIPENEIAMIRRELGEAFTQDDDARELGREFLPLGHDCDRASWFKVLILVGRE